MPAIDPDILARAEQAVAALGDTFLTELHDSLAALRQRLSDNAARPADPVVREIFLFAHDLRGQGGSFGYPLLSSVGESLCRFIEARDFALQAEDTVVLEKYFEAAGAIATNRIDGDGNPVSRALVDSLDALAGKRLSGQSREM